VADLGRLAICLALVCAAFAVAASIAGARWRRADLVRSGEHAAYACWGLVALATGLLLQALEELCAAENRRRWPLAGWLPPAPLS